VSVVQCVTAWVTGVPVIKVQSSSEPVSSTSTSPSSMARSRERKRRATSLEDDEMYEKVRNNKEVKLTARQEEEVETLKEGNHDQS
jgi:hypothetical protein